MSDSDEFSDDELFEIEELLETEESETEDEDVNDIIAGTLRWRRCNDFQPNTYHFDNNNSGLAFEINENATAYEYFITYFDEEIMRTIVNNTNAYFQYCNIEENTTKRRGWHDVSVNEMYSFLALILLMPHVKKHEIQVYWTTNPMTETSFFAKYMRRDRFVQLLRYLHFADNNNPNANDSLWKIRNIFDNLNTKFGNLFTPFQKLVIDESLILFKGRLRFKQYIPSKRHRFGIKLFVICDCETGILLKVLVYTASDVDIPHDPLGMSAAIIRELMRPYLNKGHLLYTDNWYTDPRVALYLHQNETGYCGTVKKNRRSFPQFTGRLQQGRTELMECENTVLAIKWNDKRDVHMITTFHAGKLQNSAKVDRVTGDRIQKPDCVLDYTQNMRLVDKADMQLSTVECIRKSIKWYKKLFFHLVDLVVLNCYNKYLVKTGNVSLKLKDFIQELIQQIIEKHGSLTAVRRGRRSTGHIDRLAAINFMERHFPDHVPGTDRKAKGQRTCHVCAHTTNGQQRRKLVTTWCPECKVGLCLGNCFKIYHTKKSF